MSNEINRNTASSTHYINKAGRIVILDEIQYFEDSVRSKETYSIRLHLGSNQAFFNKVLVGRNGLASALLTSDQGSNLWSHIIKNQQELEFLYGRPLIISEPNSSVFGSFGEGFINITRKSRISEDFLIREGFFSREAWEFLETAYSSGVNILINGVTGAGKTRLLNTLMDSCKDYKPTVLLNDVPEIIFGVDHSEIAEIRSPKPSDLIQHAIAMNRPRVAMDDVFMNEQQMKHIAKAAKSGTQFIVTAHGRDDEEVSDYFTQFSENPFELYVYTSLQYNSNAAKSEDLGYKTKITIKQVIRQEAGSADRTETRTLFVNDERVAEPTRTLRRKMESSKRKPTNAPLLSEDPAPAFVSLSPDEKAQLDKHREALREHFKTQNAILQDQFCEIDRILAKF